MAFAIGSVIGLTISKPAAFLFKQSDPKEFVLDEVAGMMLSLLWLPRKIWVYIAAFVLFRVLDIFKPWPISLIQKSKHPSSIMSDDLAAGAFTNLILRLFVLIISRV